MVPDRLECPHAGCNAVNSPLAQFCARCGRPLRIRPADTAGSSPMEPVPGPRTLGWMTFCAVAIVVVFSLFAITKYQAGGVWFVPLAIFGGFWFRRRGPFRRARMRRHW